MDSPHQLCINIYITSLSVLAWIYQRFTDIILECNLKYTTQCYEILSSLSCIGIPLDQISSYLLVIYATQHGP